MRGLEVQTTAHELMGTCKHIPIIRLDWEDSINNMLKIR